METIGNYLTLPQCGKECVILYGLHSFDIINDGLRVRWRW